MCSFRVIVIVEGNREWSRAGSGVRADGGLLGAIGRFEREEWEELEEGNLLLEGKE